MKKAIVVVLMVIMTVGFEWSFVLVQSDIITITVKNQFPIPVVLQVNSNYAGNIPANSSLKTRVNIGKGPVKIEIWGYENPKIIAAKTFTSLTRGQDIIWATGNVELNPIFSSTPPAPPVPTEQPTPKVAAPPQTVTPPPAAPPEAPKATPPTPVAAPAQAAATPAAMKNSTISYVTSISTLSYQGQKAQNQARTVSFSKFERQKSQAGATYIISGQGGLKIGKEGTGAIYGMSPIMVIRNLTDQLSSDKKGLDPWLTVVNDTLKSLTHKRMTSGSWEELITLAQGDGFPGTVRAQFNAQPLPSPDDKWIAITADSGLISFPAADETYQDSLIYGRYRGVLVYAPKEDTLLQSAAAFTLYHGEDQFRIEQMQYASDANGKQLEPGLNVASYLDFKPSAPPIAAQGPFPSWCVQAAHVLDLLDLAIMTAAESSTNWISIAGIERSMLNLINHDYTFIEKVLGRRAAEQFLGDWMKVINFNKTQHAEGTFKAMLELGKDLVKDAFVAGINLLPLGIGLMYEFMDLAFTVQQASFEQMDYDMQKLMRAPLPQPAKPITAQPAPPVPMGTTQNPTPPPDDVKAPAEDTSSILDDLLLPAGLLALGAGTYFLANGSSGGGDDCPNAPGPCPENPHGEYVDLEVPASCDCPKGMRFKSRDSNSTHCGGCPSSSGVASIRLTTRIKR